MRMLACWLLLALPLLASAVQYAPDITGQYCELRRGGCCPGRKDDCGTPILGTLCYCDDFCNRTRNEDCCPDFWYHCKGLKEATEPPQTVILPQCTYGLQSYDLGDKWKDNCNECKCTHAGFGTTKLECEEHECIVRQEVISHVNGNWDMGWRASNYSMFWGRRLQEGVELRLGTLQPQKTVMRMTPVKRTFDSRRLPLSFDARSKWRGLMQDVTDQGWCGASWAISTAAVASDRFAVMSNGTEAVKLAPNHLIACNTRGQQGCKGGHLDRAWLFMRKFGLVEESCYPYESSTGSPGRCRITRKASLQSSCPYSRNIKRTDMYRMGPAYKLGSEEDIMHEIMNSGPVQATMQVHQDFFVYRSGIYRRAITSARQSGYHSVRIVGWGEEESTPYWLVANSWGQDWGENGYFRIRRGTDECEIEQFVIASWAQESRSLPASFYSRKPVSRNELDNRIVY